MSSEAAICLVKNTLDIDLANPVWSKQANAQAVLASSCDVVKVAGHSDCDSYRK